MKFRIKGRVLGLAQEQKRAIRRITTMYHVLRSPGEWSGWPRELHRHNLATINVRVKGPEGGEGHNRITRVAGPVRARRWPPSSSPWLGTSRSTRNVLHYCTDIVTS